MISSEEALTLLNKWHKGSTKLVMAWAISGARGWCVGKLKHSSESELWFTLDSGDEREFLFIVNVHPISTWPRFNLLDGLPVSIPGGEEMIFGDVLEIVLRVDPRTGENEGRIFLGEFFTASIKN